MVTVEEEERRRISREMHDQTGQHLAGLGLALGQIESAATTTWENAAVAMKVASDAAQLASEAAQYAGAIAQKVAEEMSPFALELAQSASAIGL